VEEMCINTGGNKYENFYVKNSNQHHSVDIGASGRKNPKKRETAGSDLPYAHDGSL
jgi:hypothetical protein